MCAGDDAMPLYEYTCRSCGHRFEVLQRMGAGSAGLACPRCSMRRPRRELSTFAAATGGGREESAAGGCEPGGCDLPGCGAGGGFCDLD
jgi:putative FmdB family regulatory protein